MQEFRPVRYLMTWTYRVDAILTRAQVRSASGTNLLTGIWLLLSPWALFYIDTDPVEALNDTAVGALVALFGLARVAAPRRYSALSGMNAALGLWITSPWIMGYTLDNGRLWSCTLVGVVVMLCAAWSAGATIRAANSVRIRITRNRYPR